MDMSNTRRIVILGKTGAGKSSLGNTIFGEEDRFMIGHTLNSETRECQAETKSVNGRNITLIDTPGFFDTDRSEEELEDDMARCITECAPGPHAFLIVLKVDRVTEQEQAVITKINQYFSEEVFKYATVLFTHGDQLPEGQTIEDFLRNNNIMSDLMEKCGGRCHVIDNKYWKNNQQDEYRNNQFHVEELLKTIDTIIEANEGSCYTNEMLQAVEEEIQQEEELIRQSSGHMSEEEVSKQAKGRVSIKLAGAATGALFGAFFGVAVMVKVVVAALKAGLAIAKIVTAGVAAAKEIGAAAGGNAAEIGAEATGGIRAEAEVVIEAAAEIGAEVAKGIGAAAAAGGTLVKIGAAGEGTGAKVAGAAGKSLIGVTVASAVVGAVVGGVIGYFAVEETDTLSEAVKRAAKAVKNGFKCIADEVNDFSV